MATIEEKAKAYDEAIEMAKKWRNAPNVDKIPTFANRVIDEIFPELCESEDEKVRKAIIELVKQSSEVLDKQNQNNMIAWLEKQGEHANFRNKIQVGDKVTRNRDGMLVNLSQLNRVAKKDEKQGESYTKKDVDDAYVEGTAFAKDELEKQEDSFIKWNKNTKDNKPPFNHSVLMLTKSGISEGEWRGGNQWLQYRWSGIVRDSDVIGWMELSVLEKQGNQNHIEQNLEMVEALRTEYEKGRADAFAQMQKGWSEEDEKMLNSIIEDFGDGKTSNMLQEYWLKSIKERIGE